MSTACIPNLLRVGRSALPPKMPTTECVRSSLPQRMATGSCAGSHPNGPDRSSEANASDGCQPETYCPFDTYGFCPTLPPAQVGPYSSARRVPQSARMLPRRRVHRGFQYAQAACPTSRPEAFPVSLENMVRAHRTLGGPLCGCHRWLLAGRKYASRVGDARARSGIAPRATHAATADRERDGILRKRDQVASFNDGTVHCNTAHRTAPFGLDAALDRQSF
jgi:hypothetical protein